MGRHQHAAKLRPGCVTWPIVELLRSRGEKGATTRECKAAVEAAGNELMNTGAALMDIRKRAPADLGCALHSEPAGRAGRSRVYRYWFESCSVGAAGTATSQTQPLAAVAVPAAQPRPSPPGQGELFNLHRSPS